METIDKVILQSVCHTKNKHDIVYEYMWFVVMPGRFHSRSVAGESVTVDALFSTGRV